jgi:HAE1 family hydrophobic/amphiphilic exporter-1
MVIGLAAKNAILIVEFAKDEYERGQSLVDAALAGARLRLRPILMTAFAFIFGVLPLAVSTGAGANSRQILGTTVVGGMLTATFIAIFIIPVTFYVSERFSRRRHREEERAAGVVPVGADGEPGEAAVRQGEPITAPVKAGGEPGDAPHTGGHA